MGNRTASTGLPRSPSPPCPSPTAAPPAPTPSCVNWPRCGPPTTQPRCGRHKVAFALRGHCHRWRVSAPPTCSQAGLAPRICFLVAELQSCSPFSTPFRFLLCGALGHVMGRVVLQDAACGASSTTWRPGRRWAPSDGPSRGGAVCGTPPSVRRPSKDARMAASSPYWL